MFCYRTILFLFVSLSLQAQKQEPSKLLQVYGVVKSVDGVPLSLATVRIRNEDRATLTSTKGVFSIVAREGDTLIFTYVGYKPVYKQLPLSGDKSFYYMSPLLEREVIELPDFVADPLPTRAQFERDFVNMPFDDDMALTALRNLDPEVLKRLMVSIPLDGKEASSFEIARQMNNYEYYRQQPSFQILNPFAWVQFLKKLKSGEIKFK